MCILKRQYIIQFSVKMKHCNLVAPNDLSDLSVCLVISTFEHNHENYALSLKTEQ